MHEHISHPMALNGAGFNVSRPSFHHNSEMCPAPVRHHAYNPMYHQQQQMLPRPSFAPRRPAFQPRPMMPIIQPHVNPHFVAQLHPPRFPELVSPMHAGIPTMEKDEDMPVLPEKISTFEPTPPSRLSPRSAK